MAKPAKSPSYEGFTRTAPYSQVPILYGPSIAKVAVAPVSPELAALKDAPLDVNGKPNGLRDAIVDVFRMQGGEWEVRVQLCADLEAMPVEDASAVWPEERSPYLSVGRIRVPPQAAWSEERSRTVDRGFAFTPWHGLAAHRPFGSIMRTRKAAYEMSAAFRAQNNERNVIEPRDASELPT